MLWPVGDDAIMCAFPIPSAVPETPPSAFPKSRPDPFTHRRPSKDTVHGPRPCANSPARLELSDVSGRLSTDLSPLECAVPRFRAVTPLECAVTKRPACKSFRMRSYEKSGGEGARPIRIFGFSIFSRRTHKGASRRSAPTGRRALGSQRSGPQFTPKKTVCRTGSPETVNCRA